MTNHFHVVDPQGQIHTRSSKGRTYTHTVLVRRGRGSVDRFYASVEVAAVDAGKSYDRTVDESKGIFPKAELWRGPAALKSWTDFAIEYLAKADGYGAGREAVIEAARAKRLQDAQAYEAGKSWDRYENIGWCSRLDLAQKLAAKPPYITDPENVVILEAQVGKPPKAVVSRKEAA